MNVSLKTVAYLGLLALLTSTTPTMAKTRHHHVSHKHAVVKKPLGKGVVSSAQQHLTNLGYYNYPVDGKLGPHTSIAIKAFEREYNFPVDGRLTPPISRELAKADQGTMGATVPLEPKYTPPDFYATHPDAYGYVNPQYSDPMQGAGPPVVGANQTENSRTAELPTRYGNVELAQMEDGSKRYLVGMNSQPSIQTDMQPAVIGVSRTYSVGADDAIIVTAFNSDDPVCTYKNWLLIVNQNGPTVQPIKNCGRGYQAQVNGTSLLINFSNHDTGNVVGETWRYEGGRLERL